MINRIKMQLPRRIGIAKGLLANEGESEVDDRRIKNSPIAQIVNILTAPQPPTFNK
jgi:hypothetical protein